jgi:hypothetical protein
MGFLSARAIRLEFIRRLITMKAHLFREITVKVVAVQ